MPVYGLDASFEHTENGMTRADMEATKRVANRLDEVIIFRSTGPWSRRWLERRYPSKNFHVKGKSSDWGPQAGFVPYLGKYSKVGADTVKADKGTEANDDGIRTRFASTTQLTLTEAEILLQLRQPEEDPPRRAIDSVFPIARTEDKLLFARRTGDFRPFAFRAVHRAGGTYAIEVYPEELGVNPFRLVERRGTPLLVMTSSEVGAGNRPMTGDYDLMAVCPTWNDYGNRTGQTIFKPGVNFIGKGPGQGARFGPQTNLDRVLDMATNTGARPVGGRTDITFQGMTKKDAGKLDEHGDMGNVTPRILRCINALNEEMGATGADAPFRRVHHNAESHRNQIFAALVEADMKKGEGFPLTAFQPTRLISPSSPVKKYQDVATLETLGEFKAYALLLNEAGFFVPRNWTWGMSIRDTVADIRPPYR